MNNPKTSFQSKEINLINFSSKLIKNENERNFENLEKFENCEQKREQVRA